METPEISATTQPRLRDLVEHPEQATPDLVRDSAWAFARTTGLEDSPIGTELADLLTPPTEAVETLDFGGLLSRLRDFFDGSQEVEKGTEQKDLQVGVYWIDVPLAAGSAASLKVECETEDTVGATLKIAGTGGGPSSTVTITKSISIDDAPISQIAVVSAPATFLRIELHRGGNVTVFARLASVDWSNSRWQVGALTTENRPSLVGAQYAGGLDLTNAAQMSTMELAHKAGTKWDMSIGLKLEQLGLDASIDVSGAYNQTVTLTYKLAAKYSYRAVRLPLKPGYWWTEP